MINVQWNASGARILYDEDEEATAVTFAAANNLDVDFASAQIFLSLVNATDGHYNLMSAPIIGLVAWT